MTELQLIIVGLAAVVGGAVNSLAGGGTLITFPMLTAIGIPTVDANITNTIALCPGYVGGTLAQIKDLNGRSRQRLFLLTVAGILGGIVGGILLLNTAEKTFRAAVPYMILFAVGLLAVEEPLSHWRARRNSSNGNPKVSMAWTACAVFLASIYGGYFGGGLGIIVLAVLDLTMQDSLTRLNALKQMISFWVNTAAAVFFLFSDKVVWSAAVVMAVGALIGGVAGGMLAGWIRPKVLRGIVMVTGVIIAIIYFIH